MKVLQSFWTATNNGNQVAQVKDLKGNKQKWLVAKQDRLMWEQDKPTDKQLGKANQRGYNVLVFPKRDFGLWYQWRGAGGVVKREKEVAVKVKMNPGGREMGTGGTSL